MCLQSTKNGFPNPVGADDGRLREIPDTFEGNSFRAIDGILTVFSAPTTAVVYEKFEQEKGEKVFVSLFGSVVFNAFVTESLLKLTRFEQDKAFELSRQAVVCKTK